MECDLIIFYGWLVINDFFLVWNSDLWLLVSDYAFLSTKHDSNFCSYGDLSAFIRKKFNFPGVNIGFYMLCWTSQCFCAGFSTHKLNILCLAARTLLCSEVFASPKVAAFLCKRLVCTAHHHCIE